MTSRRFVLIVCFFLGLFRGSESAWATTASELWSEATEALAAGDDDAAAAHLSTLIHEHPDDALTDDALFLIGNLFEEKLGKPKEAVASYRQLLSKFPDSRSALAASRRLERLERGLGEDGDGARVLVEFQEILRGAPSREVDESIRLAQTLANDHPQWSQLHQVHLWLARATLRTGDLASAASYYERASVPPAPNAAQITALLGMTEVAILRGQHRKAETILASLSARTDLSPSDSHAIEDLSEFLDSSRRRSTLLYASGVLFVLAQLLFLVLLRKQTGSLGEMGRVLRRPTTEFFYMLPVAALLIIMALTGHQEIGPAVALICAGGLITTYLASAVLDTAKPLTVSRAAACATASLLATVSICYLALQRSQLIDLVATTVRFGPE